MRRSNRRKSRIGSNIQEISLTPLIDTALTLLIIFMVTTPMIHNAIKLNLPRGQVKEDIGSTQELVVYIDKDEKIYINGLQMKTDNFLSSLRTMVGQDQEKMVYVKADRSVSYGFVTETVDQMKCIEGIAHVALATQRT